MILKSLRLKCHKISKNEDFFQSIVDKYYLPPVKHPIGSVLIYRKPAGGMGISTLNNFLVYLGLNYYQSGIYNNPQILGAREHLEKEKFSDKTKQPFARYSSVMKSYVYSNLKIQAAQGAEVNILRQNNMLQRGVFVDSESQLRLFSSYRSLEMAYLKNLRLTDGIKILKVNSFNIAKSMEIETIGKILKSLIQRDLIQRRIDVESAITENDSIQNILWQNNMLRRGVFVDSERKLMLYSSYRSLKREYLKNKEFTDQIKILRVHSFNRIQNTETETIGKILKSLIQRNLVQRRIDVESVRAENDSIQNTSQISYLISKTFEHSEWYKLVANFWGKKRNIVTYATDKTMNVKKEYIDKGRTSLIQKSIANKPARSDIYGQRINFIDKIALNIETLTEHLVSKYNIFKGLNGQRGFEFTGKPAKNIYAVIGNYVSKESTSSGIDQSLVQPISLKHLEQTPKEVERAEDSTTIRVDEVKMASIKGRSPEAGTNEKMHVTAPEIDIRNITDRVYHEIERKIQIERERRGLF